MTEVTITSCTRIKSNKSAIYAHHEPPPKEIAMNAVFANELILPTKGQGRRHSINDRALNFEKLSIFNSTLRTIEPRAAHVDADQIATLARELDDTASDSQKIYSQLSRAERIRAMLNDENWNCPQALRGRGEELLAYIAEVHDLIPDTDAAMGHLDDALLVSLTWRTFSAEVEDYEDYLDFNATYQPRGNAHERLLAWMNARLEEAVTLRHRQAFRSRGYAPTTQSESFLRVV
jgi:uncharacterized membrane protein YkvA (DUF1232 family)